MGRAVLSAVLHSSGRNVSTLLLAGLAALPAYADDDNPRIGTSGRPLNERALAAAAGRPALQTAVSVDVTPTTLPASNRLSNQGSGTVAGNLVDYRAWVGSGATSLGIGLTAATYRDATVSDRDTLGGLAGNGLSAPLLAAPGGPALGLGLRYQLSRDSRLTFDSLASGRSSEFTPQMRVGMEFKSPPSQVLGIARGTFMRAQLSSSSQLSLNWRGGKVALMLRSQF